MTDCLKEPHEVVVRKDHTCQGCGKKITKGEKATSSTYADWGKVWTFYECPECVNYRQAECHMCIDRSMCIEEDYCVGLIAECRKERAR